MQLDIVTPAGRVMEAEVDEFVAPGVLGEFGVLPGHIPFVSAIRPGVVRYARERQAGFVAVGPGFLEVRPDQRTRLLTQQGLLPSQIDVAAAEADLRAALADLERPDSLGARRAEAEQRRDWAQARLDAARAAG